ncbi:MAG: asparagine--tRNA ligase, partial [Clostridia bacterium]|nr:asparagine--tRNA ligase [Clostridia bacterium]
MKSILVKDLQIEYKELDGKDICVCGWARSVRANGSIGFLDLNDGTAFKGLQVVFDAALSNYDVVEKLNTGSSV